jgi:hypothetical protein
MIKTYFKKENKLFKGKVLAFFIYDELKKDIEKNDNITEGFNLDNKEQKTDKKRSFGFGSKKINVKKLKKAFKKNSYDYIIINMNPVLKYKKYILKDSLYIAEKAIYIYGTDLDYEDYIDYFSNYKVVIEKEIKNKEFVLKVDVSKVKINFLIVFINSAKNGFNKSINILGDYLVN